VQKESNGLYPVSSLPKDFLELVLPSFIAAEKIEHHVLHTTVYLIVKQNIYIYVCMYQL